MGTTVADLRVNSTDITTTSYPIIEPINAPAIFNHHLDRFSGVYNLSNNSHLFRFLVALCGDIGAGQLKRDMLLPRLEQQLEATHFGNLDRLYGNPLGLPRLSEEIYNYEPETDWLNSGQWDEIKAKDASYRARCLTWMRAIIAGPTPRGLALAAEAAIGVDCDIWERYQYVQYPGGDISQDYSRTNGINEFVIIPRLPSALLTQKERRRIQRLVDILKPVNTICTIWMDGGTHGNVARLKALPIENAASSEWFNIKRLVTGRADVVWPAINVSQGLWIDTNEREAPTLAFMNRQESVTYLTITGATASSFHVGFFNQQQRALFAHLEDANDNFPPAKAYNTAIAPVNISSGWTGGGATSNNMVINTHYPIGYFAEIDSDITTPPSSSFWASSERLSTDPTPDVGIGPSSYGTDSYGPAEFLKEVPPAIVYDEEVPHPVVHVDEWIQFELGRSRPVNSIYFEICQKPIDWEIQYKDDTGNWVDIPLREDYPVTMSSAYLPSNSNPWREFSIYFQTIQTESIRILFERRSDRFPLYNSDPFPFSIEIRDLHIMHTIPSADDFIADNGVDVLGNQFRTAIQTYASDNVLDGSSTPWYSQPNPSKFAVEALYFELEDKVIDEIYLDPVTYGCDMHFYYSTDEDVNDWDEKLWVPIPKNYILKRGYHALPRPIQAKFFKIEFSNLTAIPYEPVQFPTPPIVTFRRYPIWINNYFTTLHPIKIEDTIAQVEPLKIDPLTFGFVQQGDKLVTNYEATRIKQLSDPQPEIKFYIDKIINQSDVVSLPQANIEAKIEYHSVMQWQTNLISNLDTNRALSRVALEPHDNNAKDTGWNSEMALPAIVPPVQASIDDMSTMLVEKIYPVMFFSRRCRHQYQIVRALMDKKIAYIVGVNEVGFYRRDFVWRQDDRLYIESLDDTQFAEVNDFIQTDWRWTVD